MRSTWTASMMGQQETIRNHHHQLKARHQRSTEPPRGSKSSPRQPVSDRIGPCTTHAFLDPAAEVQIANLFDIGLTSNHWHFCQLIK